MKLNEPSLLPLRLTCPVRIKNELTEKRIESLLISLALKEKREDASYFSSMTIMVRVDRT